MRSNISTLKKCQEQLCYISSEHILNTAFVVPDSYYEAPSILPNEIKVYHPIHTWADSITDFDVTSDGEESTSDGEESEASIKPNGDNNRTIMQANTDINV